MKRVIALLICLMLTLGTLAGCVNVPQNGDDPDKHVHTYETDWSSDANDHWYKPTCNCEDAPIVKAKHTDVNNDGKCDICQYVSCEHTYAEEWTADCTNHWHAADCGHIVAGAEPAAHTDTNADGKCDVCNYVIRDIHVHLYDTEWTTDGQYHWYAPICEHADAEVTKEAHEINAAGYCNICALKINEIDKTDIAAVLAAAVARNNKVNGGVVKALFEARGSYSYSQKEDIYFTLGNNHSYINYINYFDMGGYMEGDSEQSWYQLTQDAVEDEEGNVISNAVIFGVTSYDGGVSFQHRDGAPEHLNGYTYMPGTLLHAYEGSTSTLAGTIQALYELSQTEFAKDATSAYDAETGIYTLDYSYLFRDAIPAHIYDDQENIVEENWIVETQVYIVSVAFTVNALGVVETADIAIDTYKNNIYSGDLDYEYDDETRTWTLNPDATADSYYYTVFQSSGERTYTVSYSKDVLTPETFDLTYNGEILGATAEIEAGMGYLYIDNIFPLTAEASFLTEADMNIEFIDKATGAAADVPVFYDPYSVGILYNLSAVAPETVLTLTVTFGEYVITSDITVAKPAVQNVEIYDFVFDAYFSEWTPGYETLTSVNLEAGEKAYLLVKVNPFGVVSGEYTIDIDVEGATTGTETIFAYMDGTSADYEALYFTSDVDGVYNVTFTSVEDPTVSTTVTFNVGNVGGGDTPSGEILILDNIDNYQYEYLTTLELTNPGSFNYTNDMGMDPYTFVADTTATYIFEIYEGVGFWSLDAYNAGMDFEVSLFADPPSMKFVVVSLNAGDEFSFHYGSQTGDTIYMGVMTVAGGDIGGGDVPAGDITVSETLTNNYQYVTYLQATVGETEAWGFSNYYATPIALSFTANEAGMYAVAVPAQFGFWSKDSADNGGLAELGIVAAAPMYVLITLEAGETFEFYYGAGEANTYFLDVYYLPEGNGTGDSGNDESILDGSEIYVDTFALNALDTYFWSDLEEILYTFTADEAGMYVIVVPANCGIWLEETYLDPEGLADVDFNENATGTEFLLFLEAGESISFYLGAMDAGEHEFDIFYMPDDAGNSGELIDTVYLTPDAASAWSTQTFTPTVTVAGDYILYVPAGCAISTAGIGFDLGYYDMEAADNTEGYEFSYYLDPAAPTSFHYYSTSGEEIAIELYFLG